MAEEYTSSAAKAFRKHYDELVSVIQEPDLPTLGAGFFSLEVISRQTMEMVGNVSTPRTVRTSKLVLAMMSHLDVHPEKFDSVMEVLRKELVYARVSRNISDACEQITKVSADSKNISAGLPQPPPTTAVGKYAAYLRKVYLRSKLPIKGKWPPSPCKKIIKLAAIEKKEEISTFERANLVRSESIDKYMLDNSMIPVSLDDILVTKDGSLPKIVVVQGAPGIGKSTFAWKFCRKWAKGKLYQNYQLVLLLRMRDTRVREAKNLSDLFYSENREVSQAVAKEVISGEGKGILFLFEGLDELPTNMLSEDSLLSNVFQGLSLPDVTVVVTSRPWAVQTLIEKCGDQISRRLEILGFTKDDISRYISNAFTEEEKGDFMEYLYTHPQLEAIMHIPLNAAFVVQIYKDCIRSKQAIPRTMTQLYSSLVKALLVRYTKSIPEFSEMKIVDLNFLPDPVKSHFEQLCILAFMSFTKFTVQVTFTDSEAALCLDSLGLMQSSADLSIDTGALVTHSFLHFTIQEFLAAYHLSLQPLETQVLFFETHSSDPQFDLLLGFLIGLNSKILREITRSKSTIDSHHLLWLHESQSPKDVAHFLGNGIATFDRVFTTLLLDIHTLTYCLCHSNCQWNLWLNLQNVPSVFTAQNSDSVSYSGWIDKLAITHLTKNGLDQFFSLPPSLFSRLRHIAFSRPHSNSLQAVANFINKRMLPNLEECFVSHWDNGFCSIGELIKAIQLSCPRLTQFIILGSIFDSSDMLPLCKYISSPSCLTYLSVAKSKFQEDSLQLLISAIPHAKTPTNLNLSSNKLSPADVEMLSVALSENSALKILNLNACSIDGEGAEHLATGLEDNHFLEELHLPNNSIDKRGAAALSQMLAVNTSLMKLNLVRNESIGVDGAMILLSAFEHNNTLQKLHLPSNCEPMEYQSFLMDDIRKSGRVKFFQ